LKSAMARPAGTVGRKGRRARGLESTVAVAQKNRDTWFAGDRYQVDGAVAIDINCFGGGQIVRRGNNRSRTEKTVTVAEQNADRITALVGNEKVCSAVAVNIRRNNGRWVDAGGKRDLILIAAAPWRRSMARPTP
jgi:hypothetical protein